MCVCVFTALVFPAAELEQLGSYSSRVHGLPYLRRGQGKAAEVHPQAWQVRQKHMCMQKDTHLVMQSQSVICERQSVTEGRIQGGTALISSINSLLVD